MESAIIRPYRVFSDQYGAAIAGYDSYSAAERHARELGEYSEDGYSVRKWDGVELRTIRSYCRADFR
jgi:hypothetical protein